MSINCSATTSQEFIDAENLSQAAVPWIAQPKYGNYTVYFLVVVIFLQVVKRVITYADDRKAKKSGSPLYIPLKPFIVSMTRYIGYRRVPHSVSAVTGLPSSVGMLLISGAGLLYMLCYCFIPHFWYRTCFQFGSPPLAVRAGIMANALTPFIFALSGKVNLVTAVTGISYEKLNCYHRAVAWFSFLFSMIHTVPFFYQPAKQGGAAFLKATYNSNPLYPSGVVALVFLFVLCFFSLKYIRQKFYEIFLGLHWPVAIAYLGILAWHDKGNLQSWRFLWASLGVILTGYCYRYLYKTNYLRIDSDWYKADRATLKDVGDGATEINIFSSTILYWKPGQHMFVRFLSLQPLGNHPFSLASLPEYDASSQSSKIRMICRSHGGFTKILHEQATGKVDSEYKVLLDGPYGGVPRDIAAFEQVVLICTGSGATAIIPFVSWLVQVKQNKEGYTRIATKRVRLLWVIRNRETLQWFKDDLETAMNLAPPGFLDITVHCTGSENHVTSQFSEDSIELTQISGSGDESKNLIHSADSLGKYKFPLHKGRPNINQTVREWSSEFASRTAIISSGSQNVSVEIANEVANLQKLVFLGKRNAEGVKYNEIYLHTETFGW